MVDEKNSAISKRLKLSQAQQYLLLAVLVATVIVGTTIALSMNFIEKISFNVEVISEKDQAIVEYSTGIKTIGVCKKPKGDVYTEEELTSCKPDDIDVETIPGTLRYNIIKNLAADFSLNSVSKEGVDVRCINPDTNKNYTIKELNKLYTDAEDEASRSDASDLIKVCSALRTIPDALPSNENQEAFLSSLNKIFIISGWDPESLSPSSEGSTPNSKNPGTSAYKASLVVEASSKMVKSVLQNIERSIRDIYFTGISIEYSGDDYLRFSGNAYAFFVDKTSLSETTKTIKPEGQKGKK